MIIPNDTKLLDSTQWYLHNYYNNDCDIDMSSAWDIIRCPDTLKIAVIGDGALQDHQDLRNIWDLDSTYYLDRDGDTVWTHNSQFEPWPGFQAEGEHEVCVTGIIAAETNNNLGISGVAWGAKIQCKGFGRHLSDAASGISHAARTGAHVINVSHGHGSFRCPDFIRVPVEFAYLEKNCTIVCSYGNNNPEPPFKCWPAQLDEVISVGALTPTADRDSLFYCIDQNWGSEDTSRTARYMDLTAPGDTIWTTDYADTSNYRYFRGTSASAPIVSGVAALIMSRFPNLVDEPDSIKEILIRSATWFDYWGDPDVADTSYGAGMVNAYHAVAPPYNATEIYRSHEDAPNDSIYPKLTWVLSTSPDVVNYRIKAEYFYGPGFDHRTYYYPDVDATVFIDSSFTLPETGYVVGEFVVYRFSTVDYSGLRSPGRTKHFGDPTSNWPVDFVILNENTIWDGIFARIPDSLIIPEGVSLSLVNGTKVLFDGGEDNHLIVEGELIIEGSDGNEILLVKDTSETSWGGIIQRLGDGASSPGKITINYCEIEDAEVGIHAIDSLNDDNRISHVTFTDCDWGVYQDSTELDIDSCEFTGGEKGIYVNDVATASAVSEYHGNTFDEVDIGIHGDNSVVYIYDCDISNTTDEGIYLDDCDNSLISNVTVDSAGSYGIYIKYSNNVTIDSTESTYNDESGLYFYESGGTVYWSDFTDNLKSGVRCNNSSPTISSCIISDNGTHGLSCTSSAQPSLYQRNTLEDNAGYQFATTYKYFPVTNNGLNNIFCAGNDSILNYTAASKPPMDYPCTNNYWGGASIDPYKLFYSYDPGDTIIYTYIPFAGSQFSRSAQKRTLSTYDDSLSAAFAHESLREWSDASRIFYWIAVNDSSDFNRSTAILHWLHDDNADSTEWTARLDSLEAIEDDLDEDSELFEPIGDATARCLVGARRWEDAISIYTDRMENALEMTDSLLAEIHIGAIYVNWAGALNSPERPGGRRKVAPGNPVEPETSFDPTEWETLEYQLSKTSTVPGSQDWKPV
ncbi:MAG: S8 family serine peptidase, partial [Candidatus Electryonea clarkiae]|nr:S8 family serine peptidase [Candidatus Electryonea clarkiae]